MVGSSKILTVSYGTFSCTLEGFDDSFDTMKAIAEYFRDLASDDRYFGAEPPTPDAEMLARIAEREVSRRVEARTEGSGILLRTGEALPPVAQPAPQAAPVAPSSEPAAVSGPSPEPAAAPEAKEVAQAPARVAPQQPPAPTEAPKAATAEAAPAEIRTPDPVKAQPTAPVARPRPAQDPDSVAAKLQRIRAVVGRQPGFADDEEEDIAPAASAQPAAGMFDTAPKPAARQAQPSAEEVAEPKAAATETDATPADTARNGEAQEAAMPSHPPRARVVRMRKADFDRAVARGEAHRMIETHSAATTMAEDEDAPDEAAVQSTPEAMPDAAPRAVEPETETAMAEPEAKATEEQPDSDAAIIEALSRKDEDDAPASAPAAPTDAELSEEAERALLEELAALEREMGFEQDGPAQREMGQQQEATAETGSLRAVSAEEGAARTDDQEATGLRDVSGDFAVAKAEDDAALAMAEQAEADDSASDEGDSPEAEAPRDRRATDTDGSESGEAMPQASVQALGTDEADMSRILSATAARMDDPESGRRREAISQLKAAVAATEAARQLGEVEPREATEEAFRDDLRQAVRPRRPVRPTREAEPTSEVPPRAERPRPAPLKLVASQRVDLAEEPARGCSVPVRPRRVAVAAAEAPAEAATAPAEQAAPRRPEPVATASESFATFAERMGAQELGELLEAAAAYTAFVEGAEDFSRPQLMERVREVSPEPISREDGLRSFGTLLRQGMLKRVRSGRFAVAGSSRFNPERRAG